MHAGFSALRGECPVNFRRPVRTRDISAAAQINVKRVEEIWGDCSAKYSGPFLFGAFGAADAMHPPMVARLSICGIAVGEQTRTYMDTIIALRAWAEWRKGAP